ncbi:MAG: hypothetical protein IKQ39_07215 [Oscillospiraceae bacterium]|nr:hypothetical protein [Oscillospiraceae bacterium]
MKPLDFLDVLGDMEEAQVEEMLANIGSGSALKPVRHSVLPKIIVLGAAAACAAVVIGIGVFSKQKDMLRNQQSETLDSVVTEVTAVTGTTDTTTGLTQTTETTAAATGTAVTQTTSMTVTEKPAETGAAPGGAAVIVPQNGTQQTDAPAHTSETQSAPTFTATTVTTTGTAPPHTVIREPSDYEIGDIDMDGRFTYADYYCILLVYELRNSGEQGKALIPFSAEQLRLGDVNGGMLFSGQYHDGYLEYEYMMRENPAENIDWQDPGLVQCACAASEYTGNPVTPLQIAEGYAQTELYWNGIVKQVIQGNPEKYAEYLGVYYDIYAYVWSSTNTGKMQENFDTFYENGVLMYEETENCMLIDDVHIRRPLPTLDSLLAEIADMAGFRFV